MSQLLDELRARLRARHYSYRTEQSYVSPFASLLSVSHFPPLPTWRG
jgi:hypothetical protein